jgi:hypothetical protein
MADPGVGLERTTVNVTMVKTIEYLRLILISSHLKTFAKVNTPILRYFNHIVVTAGWQPLSPRQPAAINKTNT